MKVVPGPPPTASSAGLKSLTLPWARWVRLGACVVVLHLAASLALLLVEHLGRNRACCGPLFVASYLASMAFYMINLPGVLVARAVLVYSMNRTLGQEVAYAAVMIPTTEAVLFTLVLVLRRVLWDPARADL